MHRVDVAACRSAVGAYRRVHNIHAGAHSPRETNLPFFIPRGNFERVTIGWLLTVCKLARILTHARIHVCTPTFGGACHLPTRDACHARRARFRYFVSAVAPTYLLATVIRWAHSYKACLRATHALLSTGKIISFVPSLDASDPWSDARMFPFCR